MSPLLRHVGRYAIAIATTAAAAALGHLFSPFVQPALMHLFLVSVAAAALYGGLGPGLFAVGLGGLVADYFFFDPRQSLAVTNPEEMARLVVFAFAGVAVTLLGVTLRRARTRAEQDVVEKARLTELAEQATLQAEEEAARAEEETARAEDEAARAEAATQRIRSILESISDGFIALDRDWRITYLNPEAVRVVETSGQSPADVYGRTLWAVWPELEGTEVERGYRRAMQQQAPVHLEYLSPRGGLWFEIHAYASSEGLGLFFHDISERKRAEELLRDSESRLRLLTETVPTFMWEADAEGTITFATEQWYAFSGLTAEQTARDWLEVIHPDDQDRCVTAWRRALAAGTDYELRVRNRRVDGEYRWMLARAVPLRDADGRVTRWFGTSTDIHDQVETETALRDSEARLRLALDAGKCGVWDWDIGNDRVTWSDRIYEFHGLAPGEFGGRVEDFQRLIHPEDRERVASALAQALDRGGEYEIEFRALRPDGGVRWLATSGRLIRDDAGHPARMLGATIDLTERRRVEEHLRQSQQLELVGQLAGGVAHEVNNQMSVVLGCADFVLRRGDVPEVVRSDVEQMRSAAHRSAAVTGQLLAFSRRQILRPQVLDVSRVVEDFADVLQRTLGPDVLLRLKCVQDPGPVRADRGQLEQVLLNLTLNARDAMPLGGTMSVETANITLTESYRSGHAGVHIRPGGYVMLAVSDTGHGMDQETRRHVFEPFFTTKGVGKGTGLGLSTVYGIVKQSDGYVWVYSEPGVGTAFKIYLPLAAAGEATSPGAPPEAVQGTETVLVVEDEASVREMAARALEADGYTVLCAADGNDAVELLQARADRVDLVLTDVVMPGMNGRELASRLALIYPALPVLFTSGYTDDDVVRRGLLESGSPFLQKPFTPEELARRVRQILDAVRTNGAAGP